MHGPVLGFLGLSALVVLGAWGWGATLLHVAERLGWPGARRVLGAPLEIAVGIALFCVVGGFLVAVDEGWFTVLLAWHFLGFGLLVADQWPRFGERIVALVRRDHWRVMTLGAVGAFAVVAALGSSMANPYYNVFDDDPAYIYLAQRLLKTGGLIDQFNQRRLAGYGGGTLYQAMFLQVGGNSAPRAFEYFVAVLLLSLLCVRTVRRRLAPLGAFVLVVGVLYGYSGGVVTNEAPSFSCAVITLSVLQVLSLRPTLSKRSGGAYEVVLGVLLAGLLALRTLDLLTPLVAVAIVVLVRERGHASIRRLATTAFTLLVCSSGWAVATYRSSGTLLFPLMKGNYNSAFPGSGDPQLHIGAYIDRLGQVLNSNGLGVTLIVALLASGVIWLFHRSTADRVLLLTATVIGCGVELVVLVFQTGGGPIPAVVRFGAPATAACGLFTVDLLWPSVRSSLPTPGAGWHDLLGRFRVGRDAFALCGVAAALLATFGAYFGPYRADVVGALSLGNSVLSGRAGFTDRYASYRAVYDKMNKEIPSGAKVLAAVDYPALLDMSKFDVATLDIVGSVSPASHIPLFSGENAVIAYLRRLGYDDILVDRSNSSTPGLYYVVVWQDNETNPVYEYREWGYWFVAWDELSDQLATTSKYPVVNVGWLSLVEISKPLPPARPVPTHRRRHRRQQRSKVTTSTTTST